jgi:uncharacterized protein (DUF1697 family)
MLHIARLVEKLELVMQTHMAMREKVLILAEEELEKEIEQMMWHKPCMQV